MIIITKSGKIYRWEPKTLLKHLAYVALALIFLAAAGWVSTEEFKLLTGGY